LNRYGSQILMTLLMALIMSMPCPALAKGVVLNFSEVDISTMAKFISDLTGRNFILDDKVKGKISVYSPSQLSVDEAYNVFVSVLELKGFTVIQSGKVSKIIPITAAKQAGVTLLKEGERAPVNESYVAMVRKLENITAQEALTFLQPIIAKDGQISAFVPGNILLVVDSSLNVHKIQGILDAVDRERVRDGMEVIYLKNAAAEGVANTIRQWLTDGRGGTAQAGATAAPATGPVILHDQRLNALIVIGNENIKKAVREMVAKLDVAPPDANSRVNVYFLENTDATEMAKVIDSVIKGSSGQQSGAAAAATGAPQTSLFESSKISITPDKATNSLVIMATVNDYNTLAQVIKKLDRRSRQVFVQVVIAEVSLDKSLAFGVQAGAIAAGTLGKHLQGGASFDPFGALASAMSTSGLNLNDTTRPVTGAALLQALDQNGLVNILSTPNLLTSDNKEAEINVGENVPFQGSATQSTIGTTTSVERKDVGINLKIKPQISEGGYIRLEINQEISSVKGKGDAIDLITLKRAAKTNVVVKDKETVVIGGLIQDTDDVNVKKIPFLGDLPGIGWLFKTKTKTRRKTNLLILLTPQIVRDGEQLNAVSDNQRIIFSDAAKRVEPVDIEKEIFGKEIKPFSLPLSIPLNDAQERPAK